MSHLTTGLRASLKRSALTASLSLSRCCLPALASAGCPQRGGARGLGSSHSWLDSTVTAPSAAAAPGSPRPPQGTPQASLREGYEDSITSAPQDPHEMVSTILRGVEHDRQQRDSRVVLAVLVDNEAGVLNKVCGLLSARGFNIESLTVSPTNLDTLSRMTLVIRDASEEKAKQAIKQLQDVVHVWAVVDYTGTNSLHRELVMVKVSYMPTTGDARADNSPLARPTYQELLAAQAHKASVRDLGALFGAEVVDVGSRHITFQLTSWSRRIDAFMRMLEPWGIIEVARSGMVAMLRSPVSGTSPIKAGKATAVVDATALPPG